MKWRNNYKNIKNKIQSKNYLKSKDKNLKINCNKQQNVLFVAK